MGTLLLQSGNLLVNWYADGILVNLPGGVVNMAADVSILDANNGPGFNNQGTIVKSVGTGMSLIDGPFSNSGGSVGVEAERSR